MENLLMLAGVGQILLAVASLGIPAMLGWRTELHTVRPLTRKVFWTYAGYIWGTNLTFGCVSILAPNALVQPTALARAWCGFIAVYWSVRLVLQLTWFDRVEVWRPWFTRLGEAALLAAFSFFTLTYTVVLLRGWG